MKLSGKKALITGGNSGIGLDAVELVVDGGLTGAPFGAPIFRG